MFGGKPLDECGIHTVPCPYGGGEERCQRYNGDGEVAGKWMGGFPVPCPECHGRGTLAEISPAWLAGQLPSEE